jgi:hypothetical protein
MEALIGYHTGFPLVHDRELQFKDIDLVEPWSGKTFSVKMQNLAAKTGNFSFETKLVSTSTGETRPGNFETCVSDGYFLAWPEEPGSLQYRVAIFHTSELHDFVLAHAHDCRPLGAGAHGTNARRVFDQAENLLVRVPPCLDIAREVFGLDTEALLVHPGFRGYCRGNGV